MTLSAANKLTPAPRGSRTICLPVTEESYGQIMAGPAEFKAFLNDQFQKTPELFPPGFALGYQLKDGRVSRKLGISQRRIRLGDKSSFSVRPSFVMPYMTARTEQAQIGLFLRKFGVPYWALAHVLGRNHMFWYRMECSLGRASLVGTTLRRAPLPRDLVADEHHQWCDGDKYYLATTVGGGCCLGLEPATAADTAELTTAYGVFRQEAKNLEPCYAPRSVNTDGWKSTKSAWMSLFPSIVLILCYLHAWLSIRARGKHLGELFVETSRLVWHAFHAPTGASFSERIQELRIWATAHLSGVVYQKAIALCDKESLFVAAYQLPGCHRTSNMLDRIMRPMHRYFFDGQHLHGSFRAAHLHCRAWALLFNFAPWHPAVARSHHGWRSPAERLNQHRYHDCWLQNLLIAASLGGYRIQPRHPQNP